MDEKLRIEQFWAYFEVHRSEFSKLATPEEPFWDLALEQLQRVDEGLWFELSGCADLPREFIVTAEGHVDLFPVAEKLVSLAPGLSEWAFIALKPAQGFDFTTTYEGTLFDPRQMWFYPLESESRPNDLGIQIAIPGLENLDRTLAHNASLVILDTALGERSAALDLQYTEVTEMPADPEAEGYIELPELNDYITWHKGRVSKSS